MKNLKNSKGITRSRFNSKKNHGLEIYSNGRNEGLYCYFLEFDPDVVSYTCQKETIDIPNSGQPFRYTPDFRSVLRDGSIVYTEVKAEEYLKYKDTPEKLRVIREYLESRNFRFDTISDEVIKKGALLLNYQLIYRYSDYKIDDSILRIIKRALEEQGTFGIDDISHESQDAIFCTLMRLCYEQYVELAADMSSTRICIDSKFRLVDL
jgi:TnsA endonuclease N terminal